jgi:aldehyde dehydrogenase (NAD+)
MKWAKALQEGYGEVQEMIDICDFAVGLSRQLHGLTMHSERPAHRMYEQWHPAGSSRHHLRFQLPGRGLELEQYARLGLRRYLHLEAFRKDAALRAGLPAHRSRGLCRQPASPKGSAGLITGGREVGEWMTADHPHPDDLRDRVSTRMGKAIGQAMAARLGRALLELGGNNAIIISKDADLDIAIPGAVFGAVGTAGQRCTTTRRLIIHEDPSMTR